MDSSLVGAAIVRGYTPTVTSVVEIPLLWDLSERSVTKRLSHGMAIA
jgi:hypothetical protein